MFELNELKVYSILFKGELRAQGLLTKNKILMCMNLIFYVIFVCFLYKFGLITSQNFMMDSSSYKSTVYSGSIGILFTLILFYNAISIKELSNSFSLAESLYLRIIGSNIKQKNILLFNMSLFRTSVVTLFLFSPIIVALIYNDVLNLMVFISIPTFIFLVSCVSFLLNLEYPKLMVSSLFPALIIIFMIIFMSITFINYQVTILNVAFIALQKIFLFIIGEYSIWAYLVVNIILLLGLFFRITRQDTQFENNKISIKHTLLKSSIRKESKILSLLFIYAQSFNKILFITILALNFAYLLIVYLQGVYFDSVPTISILFLTLLYLGLFSEINNKLEENDFVYLNRLPVKFFTTIVVKLIYMLIVVTPTVYIGLILINSLYMTIIYVLNTLLAFLIIEHIHRLKNKLQKGLNLLFVFFVLIVLFILISMLLNNIILATYLFLMVSITILWFLMKLNIQI